MANLVEEVSVVKTIAIELPLGSDNIVTIYENIASTSAKQLLPSGTSGICNAFIKSLRAKATINSIQESNLPEIFLEDTEQAITQKTVDVIWTSPRKHLEVYASGDSNSWKHIGTIALLNPHGYPYYNYSLQDLFTDNLAIEVGENGRIGVKITDVGDGLLQAGDSVVIYGSVIEEATIIKSLMVVPENVQLGNMAFQPSNSVGISGGSIEGVRLRTLTEPLAIASGGTGVKTAEELKALVKQNPKLSEIVDLAALAGKILAINGDGNSIIGLSSTLVTPDWIPLTYLNSFVVGTGGYQLAYRRWADGLIEIRGTYARGSTQPTANTTTICALPVEATPLKQLVTTTRTNSTTPGYVNFLTSGFLQWGEGNSFATNYLSFSYRI